MRVQADRRYRKVISRAHASAGSFSVSTVAVASRRAPGDRIRVRSEGKKGAVIGMVTADGRCHPAGFK
jgi:hypothetical protein